MDEELKNKQSQDSSGAKTSLGLAEHRQQADDELQEIREQKKEQRSRYLKKEVEEDGKH